MVDLDHALSVAIAAAETAGKLIKQGFDKPKTVEHKGKVDLVTQTDKDAEEAIITMLRQAFPNHCFIGEESSAAQGYTSTLTNAPTWCIDPLDGTTNFVHRFPFVCTCIGLVIDKEPVLGVVHNPVLGETFTAIKGHGAFCNGQKIEVSQADDPGSALIATEVGVTRDAATMDAITQRFKMVTSAARSVRCCGSCALNMCGVACGRLDAFYEIGFGGCWDVAGATVVVREAGGVVLDPAGGPFDVMGQRVLAANAALGPTFADILKAAPVSDKEPQAAA